MAADAELSSRWWCVLPLAEREAVRCGEFFAVPRRTAAFTRQRQVRTRLQRGAGAGRQEQQRQSPAGSGDVARYYAAVPPHIAWNSVARQLAAASPDEITATARTFA